MIDRFAQIEPKVLLAVDGYAHRGQWIDRREELAAIRAGLPTLEHVSAPSCRPRAGELAFEPVPFDHPLYVLFSLAAPPGSRSRSCTATAASCSSTTRTSG